MPSTPETLLSTLAERLAGLPEVRVARNAVLPERLPAAGLIIVRDGDPGPPERVLGGFPGAYYAHTVEVEVYVQDAEAAARDARFDALLTAIGAALDSDPTLGGRAFGLTADRPEAVTEPAEGAPPIKAGVLRVVLDYATATPLG